MNVLGIKLLPITPILNPSDALRFYEWTTSMVHAIYESFIRMYILC